MYIPQLFRLLYTCVELGTVTTTINNCVYIYILVDIYAFISCRTRSSCATRTAPTPCGCTCATRRSEEASKRELTT